MEGYLAKLYAAFDHLYREIGSICAICKDHDCEGYVWLLENEATSLYDSCVPIVVVNDTIPFIHSFAEEGGHLLVDRPKPPCVLRENGLCSIYSARPLVCRMYPVGFESQGEQTFLVLHENCQFSRQLSGSKKALFFQEVIDILRSVPSDCISKIVRTFEGVDDISSFPDERNSFEIILSVDKMLKKGKSTSHV